jgi:hypothetical protein
LGGLSNTGEKIMQPGYKSKSFWAVAIATVCTALMSTGVLPGAASSAIAALVTALAGAGYSSVRAFNKGKDGKPVYKTTEFWLSLGSVAVGGLMASGAIADGSMLSKGVGAAASLLGALGYAARYQLPPVAKK